MLPTEEDDDDTTALAFVPFELPASGTDQQSKNNLLQVNIENISRDKTLKEKANKLEKLLTQFKEGSTTLPSYKQIRLANLKQEAVLSNQIEGNTKTLMEVAILEAKVINGTEEDLNDLEDIANYIKAFSVLSRLEIANI